MTSHQSAIRLPNRKTNSVLILSDFKPRTNLTEKGQLSDEYFPSDHRDQINGQSTTGVYVHFLKSCLGTGILAMPMAFSNGGLLFSLFTTLFLGFLSTHCMHILVKTSQALCKDVKVPALSFSETAEKVFENGSEQLRSWPNFAGPNRPIGINLDIRIYIVIISIPCLIIGQIRTLKLLMPLSAMANALIVITYSIVLYYLFSGPLVVTDKPLIAKPAQIPLYLATVIFALEGIGSVMPLENAMKKPQHFLGCPGVLNMSMLIVVCLFTLIGTLGYARYGHKVQASITLNLPEGEAFADTAKLLMAVAILLTYGIIFYIPTDILWKRISHKFSEEQHNTIQVFLHTGIILISGAIAVAIPSLEPFINLMGTVFLSLLDIFVPCVLETVYLWPNHLGWCKWKLFKNIFLVVFALGILMLEPRLP